MKMKSIRLFGRTVPIALILIAVLSVGAASAALVNYLSVTITQPVTVASPIVISGEIRYWNASTTLENTGSGTADRSTDYAYSGSYSVKLTAPSSSDYAKVGVPFSAFIPFNNFPAPSFYYKISSDAETTTENIGATWPIYVRESESVEQGYLSPYPVIHISDGTENHYIIGQPWAEGTQANWTVWNNTQASTVHTEALWHMEDFSVDPNITDVPHGWGPLSFWNDNYSNFYVVDVGVGLGSFGGVTGQQQSAYVDDVTINNVTYDLEPETHTFDGETAFSFYKGDDFQVAINATNNANQPIPSDIVLVLEGPDGAWTENGTVGNYSSLDSCGNLTSNIYEVGVFYGPPYSWNDSGFSYYVTAAGNYTLVRVGTDSIDPGRTTSTGFMMAVNPYLNESNYTFHLLAVAPYDQVKAWYEQKYGPEAPAMIAYMEDIIARLS